MNTSMSTLKMRVFERDDGAEPKPARLARVAGTRLADVSESEAVRDTIGVTMVALMGDPRLAMRAARVLLQDNSSRRRELRRGDRSHHPRIRI
jgi:hypothetical protein